MASIPKGSARQGLAGATLGFFVGFAAVALFGPVAHKLQIDMKLSPVALGLAVAAPLLSGSLLRIPFSAWVDTNGGRKPMLVLLVLSILGMAGLLMMFASTASGHLTARYYPLLLALGVLSGCGVATFSVGIGQVSYWFPQREQGWALGTYGGVGNLAPGLFSFLLPIALAAWGLSGAYWAWLVFLGAGTAAYALIGRNAWYFQLLAQGQGRDEAWHQARMRGQQIFPKGKALESLWLSARVWQTWTLVALYFATFGGFLALTTWLPTYWGSYYGLSVAAAGTLTACFSLGASITRIAGGSCSDRLGGELTAVMALGLLLMGAAIMALSASLGLSVAAEFLMAAGMGINNAAVFKMAPKYVPDAIGGASGWIGGLGAFGGFVVPPTMGLFVEMQGRTGYAHGFIVFVALAAVCIGLAVLLSAGGAQRAVDKLEEETEAQPA